MGGDQVVWIYRLVCTFVVLMQQSWVNFPRQGAVESLQWVGLHANGAVWSRSKLFAIEAAKIQHTVDEKADNFSDKMTMNLP